MEKKAVVITYGCQMNVNDSAKIKGLLKSIGYEIIENIDEANLVFLNTCTIREAAAEKIYSKLGELKYLKTKRDFIVAVAGCLAQEKKEELLKKNRHIDVIIGNQNLHMIPEIISNVEQKYKVPILAVSNENNIPPRIAGNFDNNNTAYVSIAYGCNNKCSYCIVPYVRGNFRSVPLQEIVEEVKGYLDEGYKEIVLLGQNVNSYGRDVSGANFTKLLKEIIKIEGKFRLRFMSPHPGEFRDELIDIVASDNRICKSMHMPLQSGSDRILELMNRGYTRDRYLEIVDKLKNKMKNIAITTDIIVGFPTETEEDFLDTLDVVKKSKFDNSYMFTYSKRVGTPAAVMDDQIEEHEKDERLQRLIEVQNEVCRAESLAYIGRVEEVLVEGPSAKDPKMFVGRTDSNKFVLFKAEEEQMGKFVNVKINNANTWTLYGDII